MSIFQHFTATKLKSTKRVGRGIGSGRGKTAGRGTKGQKSRTGANRKLPAWFEGGQTPLYRKMAKRRGFSHQADRPIAVPTAVINRLFKDGEILSPATLLEKCFLTPADRGRTVKIIGGQPLKVTLEFRDVIASKSLHNHLKQPNQPNNARNVTPVVEKPRSQK